MTPDHDPSAGRPPADSLSEPAGPPLLAAPVFGRLEAAMLDAVTDLFLEVFTRPPWNDHWESRDAARAYLAAHLDYNSFGGFAAWLDGRLVAVSLGFAKPWARGLEYWVNEFFVATDCQGRGLGSAFLGWIKAELKAEGMNALILSTERSYPAYRFYGRNGFAELGDLAFMGCGLD